ncbi:LOW QUALITY PROTEIN: three-prime repair exonuclease 1-like [Glandiceps talaboti]
MSLKRANDFSDDELQTKVKKSDNATTQGESSKSTDPGPFQTFVFIDLEATGLPGLDGSLPDITELCMVAISRSSISGNTVRGILPRVRDKLSLCLTPDKELSEHAERMTGLSRSLLQKQGKKPMDSDVDGALRCFLQRQVRPICIVSHAGDRFDFPVLKNELQKVNSTLEDVYTIDSLKFFQHHLPHQKQKLEALCRRYVQCDIGHDAEGDAVGLIKVLSLSIFAGKFLEWAQRYAVKF